MFVVVLMILKTQKDVRSVFFITNRLEMRRPNKFGFGRSVQLRLSALIFRLKLRMTKVLRNKFFNLQFQQWQKN
jgi:hypothetical protein